jgi:type IV pilus assembly protein PilV
VRRTYQEKGFTLIEVLIAVVILVFGILAVASMQIVSLDGASSAEDRTQRVTVAVDTMERLMSLSFSQIVSGNTTVPAGYSTSWVVTPMVGAGPGAPDLLVIRVTTQHSYKGITKQTTLTGVKPEL